MLELNSDCHHDGLGLFQSCWFTEGITKMIMKPFLGHFWVLSILSTHFYHHHLIDHVIYQYFVYMTKSIILPSNHHFHVLRIEHQPFKLISQYQQYHFAISFIGQFQPLWIIQSFW